MLARSANADFHKGWVDHNLQENKGLYVEVQKHIALQSK